MAGLYFLRVFNHLLNIRASSYIGAVGISEYCYILPQVAAPTLKYCLPANTATLNMCHGSIFLNRKTVHELVLGLEFS